MPQTSLWDGGEFKLGRQRIGHSYILYVGLFLLAVPSIGMPGIYREVGKSKLQPELDREFSNSTAIDE